MSIVVVAAPVAAILLAVTTVMGHGLSQSPVVAADSLVAQSQDIQTAYTWHRNMNGGDVPQSLSDLDKPVSKPPAILAATPWAMQVASSGVAPRVYIWTSFHNEAACRHINSVSGALDARSDKSFVAKSDLSLVTWQAALGCATFAGGLHVVARRLE